MTVFQQDGVFFTIDFSAWDFICFNTMYYNYDVNITLLGWLVGLIAMIAMIGFNMSVTSSSAPILSTVCINQIHDTDRINRNVQSEQIN